MTEELIRKMKNRAGKFLLIFVLTGCMFISGCANNSEDDTANTDNRIVYTADDKYIAPAGFDEFIAGNIPATREDYGNEFYITDLNMDTDEWDAYSIGQMLDLDNDDENELILNGPYGGMYLDEKDGNVIVFAEGGGAMELSYVYYDDAYWIVHSDTTHAGRQMHQFTRFDGANCIVDSFELNAEYWDQDNYDENSDFTYRGEKVPMEFYEELMAEIFG